MIDTYKYYDLFIQQSFFNTDNLEQNLKALYDYGFRTIAVNQTVDCELSQNELKKKKKKSDIRETVQETVPEPFNLQAIKETASKMGLEDFNLFNRLTVIFANQDALYKVIKSPNIKKYEILAASPTTSAALSYTCGTLEADIMTFNPENKFGLHFNRKLYQQLRSRGYHIELQYAPAIEDSTKRKNLFHASHLFHSFGKSRNIIVSSGAESLETLRGPYDIINLGFLFGLNEQQCKDSVSHCPNNVIVNSIGRRQGKAAMFVENILLQNPGNDFDKDVEMIEISDEDEASNQPKLKKSKM